MGSRRQRCIQPVNLSSFARVTVASSSSRTMSRRASAVSKPRAGDPASPQKHQYETGDGVYVFQRRTQKINMVHQQTPSIPRSARFTVKKYVPPITSARWYRVVGLQLHAVGWGEERTPTVVVPCRSCWGLFLTPTYALRVAIPDLAGGVSIAHP
jgi:hypothetical protein